MHIVQYAARDADRQYRQLPDRLVLDAARNINNHSLVQFNRFVVEDHGAVAVDDVVELVGPRVVVQLGVVDLNVMDFRGRLIRFFDQGPNLPASLGPRRDFSGIATEVGGGCDHGDILPDDREKAMGPRNVRSELLCNSGRRRVAFLALDRARIRVNDMVVAGAISCQLS